MKYLLPLCVALIAGCAGASADTLTDTALSVRANAIIHTAAAIEPDRVLGTHRGTNVVVTTRCGDVCPAYTVRVVHYDLKPGVTCTAAGGEVAKVIMPVGIGVVPQEFCIPAVLYEAKLYEGHPFARQ
ncbi:MAG: hypothetical protein ACTHPD_14425 [Rhizomicrobium sp.]